MNEHTPMCSEEWELIAYLDRLDGNREASDEALRKAKRAQQFGMSIGNLTLQLDF